MATLGLSMVGSAIGGPVGFIAGSVVGGFIDRMLFPPDRQQDTMEEGPRLEGFRVMDSTYGKPITQPYGTIRTSGNLIWTDELSETRTEETEELPGAGGGKGTPAGPTHTTVTYTYSCSFAVGICAGPIEAVLRIWADNSVLIYDSRGDNKSVMVIEGMNIKIYLGGETQTADPTIEAVEGAGNVPGFRGLAYVVFTDLPLEKFGNRIPNLEFEVVTNAADVVPYDALDIGSAHWGGNDQLHMMSSGTKFVYEIDGSWFKVDVLENEVLASKDYGDDQPGPTVPAQTIEENFDLDFEDNIITTVYTRPNYGKLCRLDRETFEILDYGLEVYKPFYLRVCRNPEYDYLVYVNYGPGGPGSNARVMSCARARAGPGLTHDMPLPSTLIGGDEIVGCNAVWADWDHENGEFYLLWVKHSKDITGDMDCCQAFCFDPVTNRLIFNDNTANEILFYDADGFSYLGKIDSVPIDPVFPYSTFRRGVINGELWIWNSEILYAIDVAAMEISRTYDLGAGVWGTPFGGGMYDPIEHAWYWIMHAGHAPVSIAKYYLDRKTESGVTLASVVSDISQKCSLTAGQIDVSELTDIVRGYLVDHRMSGRRAIEPLMRGYFFDGVEFDGKIWYPKRGKASSATIGEDELAAHPSGQKRPQEIVTSRRQELELPEQVDVSHIDPDTDYEVGNQYDRKLTGYAVNKITHRLPIVFTVDEAKQISQKHLVLEWLSRNTYQIKLGGEYTYLNPTDVITVTQGANTYLMRIDKIAYKNGYLEIRATAEDTTAYSSEAAGAAGKGLSPGNVAWEGPTDFIVWDGSMPKDHSDYSGVYIAGTGTGGEWTGAVIYKSDNGGTTWTPFTTVTTRTVLGSVRGVLDGVPNPWIWDNYNSLTVMPVYSGSSLASATKLNVLNGANAMLVGDEIIQFMTAVENTDGSFTISDLLRGRRGTEWAIWEHAAGEKFVLLDEAAGIVFKELPLTDEGIQRMYAAVSIGMPFSSKVVLDLTPEMRTLMPYAPAHFSYEVESDNDIVFTWVRRTRRGGEWTDGHDVPLYEASESYSLDILDNDETVVRTLTASSETATWTSAQQGSDNLGSKTNVVFGRNTAGADGNLLITSGSQFVIKQTLDRDSTVSKLVLHVAVNWTGNVKATIYSDNDGEPNILVATSNQVTNPTAGWNDFALSAPVDLLKGNYWLGIIASAPGWVSHDYYGAPAASCTDAYGDGPLATFGSITGMSTAFAMYAARATTKYLMSAKVYQISDDVGRGFPAEIFFNLD
jgi:hypothetical protein